MYVATPRRRCSVLRTRRLFLLFDSVCTFTMREPLKPYDLASPEVTELIGACSPEPKHAALLSVLRRFEALAEAKLVTKRGGDGSHYLSRRKVLTASGAVVHDDHVAWLREELESDGGDAPSTFARLARSGYLLSKCDLTRLYFVHDRAGESQADFIQIVVLQENERLDVRAFSDFAWFTPKDLADLVDLAVGPELPEADRRDVGLPRYRLESLIDVEAFVREAEAQDHRLRAGVRARTYAVTASYRPAAEQKAGPEDVRTHDELFPGWDKYPVKTRRLFLDWANSSAGRSGARLCDHWVMTFSDWVDPSTGQRHLSLVPNWTFAKQLAKVEARKGDAYTHFGRLLTLDRRVKVPFGWYFYMLHGNRVDSESAERVLADAEAGLIVLPEHDYRVLSAWHEQPYAF